MKKPTTLSPTLERIINKVWDNPRLGSTLCSIDAGAVIFTAIALAARVATLAVSAGWIRLIAELSVLGVSFVAVSVFRVIINMPRPYEVGNIARLDSSKKRGKSFPSRHVFSSFVIATVLVPWNVWISVGLFVIGSLMAVIRVIIGRHFPRDVIAGAIIGIVSGVIGLLIIQAI